MEREYNGWTNRETWLVNLWLTNDEGTYHAVRGMGADELEDFVDEMYEGNCTGLSYDLLVAATARVNWHEIATSLCEA